jgi:inhibitor of cysteine peptidase
MKMSKLRKIVFAAGIVGGLFLNTAYAVPTLTNMQTANNPQKSIVVENTNPQFSITLASNPTTGYSWLLDSYDNNLIQVDKHDFTRPSSNNKIVGAGGFETWTFTAKSAAFTVPQATNISFIYVRPWEAANHNEHKVVFTVVTH